ncbi:MAG: RNA 2',3'-cyclic phosphodiesterase [Solirubrobacterales bacterium]
MTTVAAERGEESPEEERIRAFIALDPPPPTVDAIAGWQGSALGPELRPLDRVGLHITLAYLGDRTPGEIEASKGALRAATAGSGPVTVHLEPVPIGLPPRRPRVVALTAASAAAVALQEALAGELAAACVKFEERRPYRPHLSVARIRGHPSRRRAEDAVAGLAPFGGTGGHTFDAVRVALYRSELRSQGPRYSPLADVELPRGAADEVV